MTSELVDDINNYGELRGLDETFRPKYEQLAILGELFWLMSSRGIDCLLSQYDGQNLTTVKDGERYMHEGYHLAGFVREYYDHNNKFRIFFNDNFKGNGNNALARLNGFATECIFPSMAIT